MKKADLSQLIKSVQKAAKKHSPEILTGLGIAGMITSTVLAVRATPKALRLMQEAEEEKEEALTPLETVQAAWKPYIPAAITATASIACLVGASSVNLRRNAALAAAYTLSESAMKEYQEKIVETIGEKKEQFVRDSIVKDKIDANPVNTNEVIITEKGNTLCYDLLSKRYFRSDMDRLKKAENELCRRMRDEMYISLNDFYGEIGLPEIPLGEDVGWDIDKGYIELEFTSHLASDGTPCLAIGYKLAPQYDYR